MASFASTINAQVNTPRRLSEPMAFFVGKPYASRGEVGNAIRTYAKEHNLYRSDSYTIKPDFFLAVLLARPSPFHIKEFNSLITRHLL
jgi:chromatin remodeling complex protein RSC6